MKKGVKLAIASACTLSLVSGFVLVKEGYERATVKNVIGYYEEGKHEPSIRCRIGYDALEDGVLTIDDLVYYNFVPPGYEITDIVSDTNPNYAIVSYINKEDVIDINDNNDLGLPISHFSSEYVRLAKKRCLK